MSNEKMKSMFAIVVYSDGNDGLTCNVLEVHKPRSQAGINKLLNAFQKQKKRVISIYPIVDFDEALDDSNLWYIVQDTSTEFYLNSPVEDNNIRLEIQQVDPDTSI
jgi:hypothetical protein